jgi:DNA (cytosine-5)-methyltransferase 3A
MNVLSLFDGMSCGRIALERVGIPVDKYFASEIDKYAIQVTQKNYPDTIQLGDVTQLNGEKGIHDLLIGGSPCQGFSFAGKGLNFEDSRSRLFFEFVRLLDETNPKYFLLENTMMKQEHQDIITRYLGVKPIEINSALVSSQNRVRLYWTNIPGITQPEDKKIFVQDILEDGNYVAAMRARYIDKEKTKTKQFIEFRHDNKSNALTTVQKNNVVVWERLNEKILASKIKYRYLTPLETERLQTVPENYTDCVSDTQRCRLLGNGWTVDVIAHIFKQMND